MARFGLRVWDAWATRRMPVGRTKPESSAPLQLAGVLRLGDDLFVCGARAGCFHLVRRAASLNPNDPLAVEGVGLTRVGS